MEGKLILISFLLISISVQSQDQLCGTPDGSLPQNHKELIIQSKMTQTASLCVNIQFHILQNSTGNNAVPESHINLILDDLNLAFNQHQIFFNNLGVNYIQNDTYYNIDDIDDDDGITEFNGLINLNDNDPNAINFYIANDIESFAGRAQRPGNSTVIASNAVLRTTNVHEVGHNFGLLHTHDTSNGLENIERTGSNANCEQTGDGLCSTPADPQLQRENLTYKVDASCNYTAGETRNGLPYDPDTSNFMSYSRRYCRDSFTQEQGDLMRAMIYSEPVLQQVVSSSCSIPKLTGDDILCEDYTYTYTLENPPSDVTWSTSSNLDIVSSNDSIITVEPVNHNLQEEGFITAIYNNGAEATKEVHINNPILTESDVTVRDSYFNSLSGDGTMTSPYLICEGEEYVISMYSPKVHFLDYSTFPSGWTSYSYGVYEIAFTPNNISSFTTYSVLVDYTGACGSALHTIYFAKETYCAGGMYVVSPNPTSNNLNVEHRDSNKDMTTASSTGLKPNYVVYDFQSRPVKRGKLKGQKTSLDVSALIKGIYILKIYGEGNVETHKIIIE